MSAGRKLLRYGFHRKASPVPFEEPTVRSAGTNGPHYGPPVTHGVPDKKPQDVLGVPSLELSLSSLGSRMVALNVAAVGGGEKRRRWRWWWWGVETESPFVSLTSSSHTRFSLQHEWWAEPIVCVGDTGRGQ